MVRLFLLLLGFVSASVPAAINVLLFAGQCGHWPLRMERAENVGAGLCSVRRVIQPPAFLQANVGIGPYG